MIVVADTGPLNYLIRMDRVELLRKLYGEVIFPRGVVAEMLHEGAPLAVRVWASALPDWVTVVPVTDSAPA